MVAKIIGQRLEYMQFARVAECFKAMTEYCEFDK